MILVNYRRRTNMSDIKRSFSELIGNTPLYAAERFAQKANAGAEILANSSILIRPARSRTVLQAL